jgi:hydrogenase nickel incorporation protein HypB
MMCTTCGCGEGEASIEGHHHHHDHAHPLLDYGKGPARGQVPGFSQARMVRIEQDILAKNNDYAAANRRFLAGAGITALNLVSSPGSGKTTLLTRTLHDLKGELPMAVIEGDQQTSVDADRIRATGARALQINTGKGCHLDAHMVGHALASLKPEANSLLFIENVGNLVCPAAFDLGEDCKVAILSVTEGEDKPLKYPDMFAAAGLMLLNKVDLLPRLRPARQSRDAGIAGFGDHRRGHGGLVPLAARYAAQGARRSLRAGCRLSPSCAWHCRQGWWRWTRTRIWPRSRWAG